MCFHVGIMLPIPYNVLPRGVSPVVTVVGGPVSYVPKRSVVHEDGTCPNPCEEDVLEFMEIYIEHVKELYNTHADQYNSVPGKKLIIV